MQLYRHLFPNTLSDVYERLTGEPLEGAHGALADITATKKILDMILPSLVEKAEVPIETAQDIDNYLQGDKKRFDLSGKMYTDVDGVVRWNFSKNKDKPVLADLGFVNWFMGQSFPQESKNKIKELQQKSNKHE